jgi:riboflavin kinase/FMN adenylyltransferase
MLGRPYSIRAEVVKGDGLGRQLGFPTANLDIEGLVLPPSGVYAAQARVDGRAFDSVLNIGHRPTLNRPERQLRVEAYLLGFSEDLYGQHLDVTPRAKLREEQRFPSLEALRSQITRDIAAASGLRQQKEH